MKTASFVLEESHIDWIEVERRRQGNTSGSAIVRRLIAEAMEKDRDRVDEAEKKHERQPNLE